MFKRWNPGHTLRSMALDMTITVATLLIATAIRLDVPLGAPIPDSYTLPPVVIALLGGVWGVVFLLFAVYDPRRNYRFADEAQRVVTASLFALLAMAGALYFTERMTSRLLVIYFFGMNLTGLLGWRGAGRLARRLFFRQRPRQRALIVGANAHGAQIATLLRERATDHIDIVGYLDDDPPAENADLGAPILGRIDDVEAVVIREGADEVIVALPYSAYDHLHRLVPALHAHPVQVRIAPNYLSLALHRASVEEFGGLAFVNLRDPALSIYQRLVKRAFDLLVCAFGIPLSVPLMGMIALAVRLDSPGPVIFRQPRVGENGRLFTMFKFRSMRADSAPENSHKRADDPRQTRIGRFLRRTSLDELPQLFNVLRGEMSLVGPRPEMPWLVEKYEPWQRRRFAVPQGMTGWWQVNGRSDRPMYEHTEDDLYYIQNYSLLLDIVILGKTLFAVISRRGAY